MTRIAVVHNLKAGGAARRLTGTLSAWYAQPDVELKVFTFAGAADVGPSPLSRDRVESAWAPAAANAWKPLRPFVRYPDVHRLTRAWRQVADRVNEWAPDVVFVNPCRYGVGASGLVPWLQAPTVLYVDEARRFDYEPGGRRSANRVTRGVYKPLYDAYRKLDRGSVLGATHVVSNSSFSAGKILASYGRDAQVFPPGIDGMFHPPTAELEATEPEATELERRYVLSVGSLIPSKGHDLAIEAIAMATARAARRLLLVAPRDDDVEHRRLHAIAARVGVDLHVEIGVDDARLISLYRRAVCTVYLAKLEPLGLASLESQACGTPVVVADEGGLRETVEPDVTGVRAVREPEAVARAIDLVVSRRPQMARACRRHRPVTTEEASARLLTHLRNARELAS